MNKERAEEPRVVGNEFREHHGILQAEERRRKIKQVVLGRAIESEFHGSRKGERHPCSGKIGGAEGGKQQ